MKLSFEKIRSLLYEALRPSSGSEDISCWIKEVFEGEFVYHKEAKLYKAPYRIKDGDVELGAAVEVEEEVEYVPVFSVERLFSAFKETRDDGVVVRRGKVFEAGDFPDKNVAFDEGDLDRAVETFSPVENDLEHASTILDGKLGRLARVWKKGGELFGEVEIPSWLDKAIGDEAIKVSLAFDRSKKIVGNALVLRPRIADAAIMSAFSSSNSSTLSKGEEPKENKPMKLKDAIKHFFGLDQVDDLDVEVNLPTVEVAAASSPSTNTAPEPAPATPEAAPAFSKEIDARFAAMEAQLLSEKAFAFADEVIRNRKSVPSQRTQIAGMYSTAVRSDAGSGSVFSTENNAIVEGDQVKALKAFFENAPTHRFAEEAFVDDGAVALFGGSPSNGMSKERKEHLLALSDLGRKATGGSKN